MIQKPKNPPTRKNFLLWGIATFCSAAVLKFLPKEKKEVAETVKMLTQDGTLVEIDKKLLLSSSKKINNAELQQWVKNKPNQ